MSDLLSGLGNALGLNNGTSYSGQNTGVPTAPTIQSIFAGNNPNAATGGGELSQYVLNAQPTINFDSTMGEENQNLANIPSLNTQPLNNLESFATSGSNNPWVTAQQNALQQAQGQAMGAAQQNAAAQNTAAEDQAAARGGLNTGAMQNLARNAANNSTMAGQGVIGQGLQQQGAIQTQNAQNELGVAENLPGQEVQALQPALQEQSLWQQAAAQNQNAQQQLEENQQQYNTGVNEFNIGNQEAGLNAINQGNLQTYQNQLAAQAGQEQANAQANGPQAKKL